MQTPIQITFRHLAHSDALAAQIQRRAEGLDRIYDRIISCHAVIELAGHHHRHGDHLRIVLNVNLPGHEIVVNHAPIDPPVAEKSDATVDRVFDDAERQLEDWVGRQRDQRHKIEHGAR